MELSARNIIKGTVTAVDVGDVNAEVRVEIAPDVVVTSVITKRSCERLGLEVGKEAYVVIKATSVMVGAE